MTPAAMAVPVHQEHSLPKLTTCRPALKAAAAASTVSFAPSAFRARGERLASTASVSVVLKLARPSSESGTPNGWAILDEVMRSESKRVEGGSGSEAISPVWYKATGTSVADRPRYFCTR